MPRLPRVSGAEAVRALQRFGFEITRQRGSHIVMRRGSSGCVVPSHREIKTGTPAGVLRQAGVSAEEFIASL
jgi:predicted RNA binding protein YcfA (HicA-like mRNA interferase family)